MHRALPPFAGWSGPRRPRVVIVGEAWGKSESEVRKPFAGQSGQELWRMLGEAMPGEAPELHAHAKAMFKYDLAWVAHRDSWLEAAGIAFTNVLNLRPPDNKLESLCGSKTEVGGSTYVLPSVSQGKYLRPEFLSELDRLLVELSTAKPNLIIALGNTACWAILRATNIGSIRGTVSQATILQLAGVKVLPTYHPAAVLRQWSYRTVVVADLMKAHRELQTPELVRPRRQILIQPTIEEVEDWTYVTLSMDPKPRWLANDIETEKGQIICQSFATSPSRAMTVPFWDKSRPDWSYWNKSDELRAWNACRLLLESPLPKLGQNWLYDLQYHLRMGMRPRVCQEDTMLLHHSLFPEMLKGLGFLGSIYTSELSWKLMNRDKPDTEKRDE